MLLLSASYLIRHNHEPPIPQTARARILFVMLQPHNLLDILDLLVLHDLVMLRFAYIEHLSAKREHAEIITANNTKSGDSKRLGGVSFGQDKRALARVPTSGIVCIVEFGYTRQSRKEKQIIGRGLLE
jgi:hypothetical protein